MTDIFCPNFRFKGYTLGMKKYFYEIMVIGLTVVLPILSTIIVATVLRPQSLTTVILNLGIYTVFWGVGVRLLLASITQITRPQVTLGILGIKTNEATQIIRELGFANLGMGIVGILSLWFPAWAPAVAIVAGVFLGLDGMTHLTKKQRNRKENVAMVTDLFVAVVALTFVVLIISMGIQ